MFQRRRERPGHAFEQFGQADPGGGADGDDRVEAAARDGGLQVRDQGRLGDLLAGEVAVHQGLVLAFGDDALDQLVARLGHPVEVGRIGLADGRRVAVGVVEQPLRDQPDERGLVPACRQIERQHAGAERILAGRDLAGHVGAVVVEPRDHHGPRHADRGALLPERDGRRVHALGRAHHEQRGIGGAQAGTQFADEVRISGRVDQVDLDALVEHGRDGKAHGALLADRRRVVVADRGALHDGTGPVHGAGRREQGLGEGGLAGTRRSHQDHIANIAGVVYSDRGPGVTVSGLLVGHDEASRDVGVV